MNAEQVRDAMFADLYDFSQDIRTPGYKSQARAEREDEMIERAVLEHWREFYPLPRDLLVRCYYAIYDSKPFPVEEVGALLGEEVE